MTVGELLKKLEGFYDDHLEVKIELPETLKYGQYPIEVAISTGIDDGDGALIVIIQPLL